MAEICLETPRVLLFNLCIRDGLKKNCPGGRLMSLATTPFNQPCLDAFLFIQGMGPETCCYLGGLKPHPFENCPSLACSCSAHPLSKEFELIWMICRERRTYHTQFHTRDIQKSGIFNLKLSKRYTNSPYTICDKMASLPPLSVPVQVPLCDAPEVRSGPLTHNILMYTPPHKPSQHT